MTRDEVASVIREGVIAGSVSLSALREADGITESVLSAIDAAGIVLGERVELTDEQEATAEILAEELGLALVRVVAE